MTTPLVAVVAATSHSDGWDDGYGDGYQVYSTPGRTYPYME